MSSTRLTALFNKIFRNNRGNIVVWQWPNMPLYGWIIFTALDVLFKQGNLHHGFHLLAQAFLFTWAYLEVRSGESIFRRVLGLIIFAGIVYNFFK